MRPTNDKRKYDETNVGKGRAVSLLMGWRSRKRNASGSARAESGITTLKHTNIDGVRGRKRDIEKGAKKARSFVPTQPAHHEIAPN